MTLLRLLLASAAPLACRNSEASDGQFLTNPVSGAQVAIYLDLPPGPGPFPVLVTVPGAVGDADRAPPPADRASYLAAGLALVRWDPDGRGRSTGSEDFGGVAHQAALAEVIAWAARQPELDSERIGVLSLSYGITAAAGALAHHDTVARFLIDYEGPADRRYTAGCGRFPPRGPIRWGACDDDSWWSHREALKDIRAIHVPYQRVQRERDHFQPDYHHSLDMVAAAMAGSSPWVRLNDHPAGTAFKQDADIRPIPQSAHLPSTLAGYATELLALDLAPPSPAE